VIAGTVFRTPGFMLAGASVEISLVPHAPDQPPVAKVKFKKTKLTCNNAGEYAVPVPGVSAKYQLIASAPGFRSEIKTGQIDGPAERIDVNFELEPVKK
jgi:hypothetical protein